MALLSGGATQLLPRDGEATELRGDPTVEPHAKVQPTEPKKFKICLKAQRQDSQEVDD